MGEYKEKVRKHFWMLIASSMDEIGSEEAFREKLEPVFKIRSDNAIKLVEDRLWTVLYSLTRRIKDPDELHKDLGSVVQIDSGKVKSNIWKLIILAVGENCDQKSFREHFEPIFKINTKKAVELVDDHLWAAFYSFTRKTKDPDELNKRFQPLVQIDVNRAAEAIKQINPEKYKFLQIYK
jgi:hypothetical protein